MKSLLLIALMSLFVSCSSSVVNDYKVKTADKVGSAVEHTLAAQYVNVSIAGVDCAAEAKLTGEAIKVKVLDLLKAKETLIAANASDNNLAAKSVGGVVPALCSFVISNAIPSLLKQVNSPYVCLKSLGSDKLVKVGNDLCSLI